MAKKTSQDPDVTLFGEVVSDSQRTRPDSDTSIGFLFIFAGLILLLNTLEILPWNLWESLLRLWPVLIIILGIKIVLGTNQISRFILSLLSLVIFGSLFLFILLQYAPHLVPWLPPASINYLMYWKALFI
jgi:hypothetical protein